jgi:hypothetical protein
MISQDKAATRCHWHSLIEPVGNCAACGRAGCGTCLVQEVGGPRCQECIRKGRPVAQLATSQPQLPPSAAPVQAFVMSPPPQAIPTGLPPAQSASSLGSFLPNDTKILVSLVIFLAGAAIPFLLRAQGVPESTLGQHIQFGYVPWALFWGAPAAWRLGRKLVFWLPSFGCMGMAIGFSIAWIAGWFYCLCGGGIYQFARHWWFIRQRTALQG